MAKKSPYRKFTWVCDPGDASKTGKATLSAKTDIDVTYYTIEGTLSESISRLQKLENDTRSLVDPSLGPVDIRLHQRYGRYEEDSDWLEVVIVRQETDEEHQKRRAALKAVAAEARRRKIAEAALLEAEERDEYLRLKKKFEG